ncbi:MAG: helix-hairpin-helix domain-containing protein [Actinobacteria bacterium]|nr:helix-hairpin-helix domain-containing protein [Actinomycetota bacterium]
MPSISVTRSTALVLVSALLALLVLAGPRLARTGTSSAPEIVAPLEATATPDSIASHSGRAALVVHVVGAVRRPGLYRLRDGARVADAVERAGGATHRAQLAALNLAAPLVDGIQVLVPRRVVASGVGSAEAGEDLGAATAGLGAKTSLASATAEELVELPGVGPVTAQKILDYRAEHGPFRSVDDLDAVPGIGPTRVEQLRDLVTP